jgi:uncharacterized membrane protein
VDVHSDLIVMTFGGGQTAQTVYSSLQAMRKSKVLGLGDSVIITKDGAGQVRLHPASAADAGVAGLLAALLFPSSERAVPAVDGVVLDDGFVGTVVSALRNNGSALMLFLGPDSLGDPVELLQALALFRGRIHQTTLCPQSAALLREML